MRFAIRGSVVSGKRVRSSWLLQPFQRASDAARAAIHHVLAVSEIDILHPHENLLVEEQQRSERHSPLLAVIAASSNSSAPANNAL